MCCKRNRTPLQQSRRIKIGPQNFKHILPKIMAILSPVAAWFTFVLFGLIASTKEEAFSVDSTVYNKSCQKYSAENEVDIRTISEDEIKYGDEPSKAPQELNANWCIFSDDNAQSTLALSISWIGNFNQQYHIEVSPFLLISVPGSVDTDDIYLQANQTASAISNVGKLNYKYHGSQNETKLSPECTYCISVMSLPFSGEVYYCICVCMPGCENDAMRKTSSCQQPERDQNNCGQCHSSENSRCKIFQDTTTAIATTTESPPTPPSEDPSNAITLIALLLASGVVFIVIVIIFCVIRFRKKDQQTIKKKSFLIVISSSEYHKQANGSYAEAGDKIACYLKGIGMKVMYTLWKATEIDNSDTFQWICNQLKMTQHLIIIYSQQCADDQCSNEMNDTTSLLTANKQDPLKVVKEMITRSNSSVKRYSIVTLNSQKDEWIVREIPQSRVFQLPENMQSFCRDIIGLVRKQDVNRMKQELSTLNL